MVIEGRWGYACWEDDRVFIPAVIANEEWPLRRVLAYLYEKTGITRMIFTAVLQPEDLKVHLRNIVREWDEYVPQYEDYSHCIEITYEPPQEPHEIAAAPI